MNHHHGLAAKARGGRFNHTQGKCCGNGGINGVAALFKDIIPCLGGQIMLSRYHTLAGHPDFLGINHAPVAGI
jgi:hypothetical protein